MAAPVGMGANVGQEDQEREPEDGPPSAAGLPSLPSFTMQPQMRGSGRQATGRSSLDEAKLGVAWGATEVSLATD